MLEPIVVKPESRQSDACFVAQRDGSCYKWSIKDEKVVKEFPKVDYNGKLAMTHDKRFLFRKSDDKL